MSRKSGRVTVKVNGDVLTSAPGASMQMGGAQRAFEMSDQGTVHHQETLVPGQISCTLIHVAPTDLGALRAFVGGVVTFEDDIGVVYVMREAGTMELGDLSAGNIEITFGGAPVERA